MQNKHINNIHTQPLYSNSASAEENINSPPQNNDVHPHDQTTLILQQFNMIRQELRNFMDKESSDIIKITHSCTSAQENAGKLIENAISQALTKPQNVMPPNSTIDS